LAVIALTGCVSSTVIHQTTQKDFQPGTGGETKNKARQLFYEGGPTYGSAMSWIETSIKFKEDGFQVGTDRQILCEYEAMGDPCVKEWTGVSGDRFGVHAQGCDVQVWFKKQETAVQFAQLIYTLKRQAAENGVAGKAPTAAGVSDEAETVLTEVDTPPAFAPEEKANAYAVVIGIENYRSIPKSDYSRRDAVLVKSYLKALGYQERNIALLTNDKASRSDVEKSLRWKTKPENSMSSNAPPSVRMRRS